MTQFNRDYFLVVEYDNVSVEIRPPMRIVFDGYKSTGGGLNKLTVMIYNLKESTRLKLIKDPEQQKRINVTLQVGYKGQLRDVFKGQIYKASSSRSGADYITKLESLDGGFAFFNSKTTKTIKSKDNAINQVLIDAGLERGAISLPSQLTRPKVMVGNSIQLLDDFLEDGYSWYIDNGKLNIINENGEALQGFIPVVSPETGLITTPSREMSIITFDTLINPSIVLGGLCQLISTVAPHINGKHKVYEIGFKGDYDGDSWQMSCKCNVGTYETVR